MNIRVVAIPTAVAELVRSTLHSPKYGHPAHTEVAKGYGPCRHCLRYFDVGKEERILFTYDAFDGVESLPQPGPVFIHEKPCVRYDEDAGFPEHLLAHPLTFIAYGEQRSFREEVHLGESSPQPMLEQLLARTDVKYIQVRDTDAGCYDFRIERSDNFPADAVEEFAC